MSVTSATGKGPNVESGSYEGYRYEVINPTSTTATLKIYIPDGHSVKAIPGCMFATSANIEIKGKVKRTMKAMFGPDEARHQLLTAKDGEGWVLLAPGFFGAISPMQINDQEVCVGDDAFLASIGEIDSTSSSQGVKKSLFSGHGLFVRKVKGNGVIFVCAVGSMMTYELKDNENMIIDNGHLVTWSNDMKYEMKKASKSWAGSGVSGEGIVASMTGLGKVHLQTRNPEEMAEWIYETKSPPPRG